jgi:hypothetical protein
MFLRGIVLWFCQKNIYGELISNATIGIFAIWEGILIIAEYRMRPYEHLTQREKKYMFWNMVRKLNVIVLPIIVLFFVMGIILQYIRIKSFF